MQLLTRSRKQRFEVPSMRDRALQYAGAVGFSLVALAIWQIGLKSIEPNPFPLLLAAVALSAFFGGLGPGLVAIVLTTLMALLYYVNAKHHFALPTVKQGLELDLYAILAVLVNFVISIKRWSEQDLKADLKMSANITRNLGEGVFAVDRDGKFVFMNPAAERLLGWSENEVRGKSIHDLIHTCEDGKTEDGQDCPLPDILRAGNTVRNDDDLFKRRDSSVLPVAYTCAPILTDGRVTGAVLTFRDITDRKRAVEAMRASEERYRILVETSHDSIWLTDLYGYVIMANERAAQLYGYMTSNDMLGMNCVELIAPDDRLRSVQDRRRVSETGALVAGEYLSLRQDGTTFPSEVSASIVLDEEDKPRAILHVVRDITERRRSQAALQSSESRLAMQYAATTVLAQAANLSEAIPKLLTTMAKTAGWDVGLLWTVEREDNVLRCRNVTAAPSVKIPGFRKLSQGLSMAAGVDLPGRVWSTGEPAWVTEITSDDNFPRALMASKEGLHGAFAFPVIINGEVYGVLEFLSFEPMLPSEDLTLSAVTIAAQVAQFIERKQAEERLQYHAMHDPLTDLPNRSLIHDRLELAVSSAQRNNKPLALLIMDLDRFREINDAFGHRVGDLILKQVGSRLKGVIRESDTVGRLGGDEYALILPAADAGGVAMAAPKILAALQQPVIVDGQNFDVSASIGAAIFPEHGDEATTLLRHADVALYLAKQSNEGVAVYNTEQDEFSPDRLALKADLREAIENDQFVLHYQPKVDLNTGRVESVEALVRWQHPQHGLIGPDQFIRLAEQNGWIQLLTMHVTSAALRQCNAWRSQGLNLRIAVNFSTSSLEDQQFVGMVSGLLRACDVPPDHLEVEVTEGAIMTDPDKAAEVLHRLHDMGVRISIDDFGTGHSSLGQLKRLPADEIKVDRSIVQDMAVNDEDSFITRSIIDLGHKLGMRVVAEGVENQETADILATLGCDLAQGTFLSQPLPADEVARRFKGSDPRVASLA